MKKVNMVKDDNNTMMFFLFTCVKDGEKYIKKLFDSLIKQTKKNFIHYIYDDGSSKPMYELINEYKQKVSKLTYPYKIIYEYNSINIGLNMATQHCINKVNLPYFIWINCDDWLDTCFFEEAEKFIDKHPNFDIYQSNRIDHMGNKTFNFSENYSNFIKFNQKKQYYTYLSSGMSWNNFIVKTKTYFKINPKNLFLNSKFFFNDMQVLLCFILNDCNFAFMREAYTHFFWKNDSEGNVKKYVTKNDYFKYLKMLNIKGAEDFINKHLYYRLLIHKFSFYISKKNFVLAKKILKLQHKFIIENKFPKKIFGHSLKQYFRSYFSLSLKQIKQFKF